MVADSVNIPASQVNRRVAVVGALVLLGIGTLVGLVLAEVVVRVVAPQQLIVGQPKLFGPVDSLGWAFQPEADLPVNTGERVVRVRTDHERFRVGGGGRRDRAKEVLLLGDSFVAALQVDHEQSVAGLLEAFLGDSVSIRNAGVPGWGPSQYLLRARSLMRPGRFDAVVVMVYVGNDIVTARRDYYPPRAIDQRARFHWPRRMTWKAFVEAFGRPINDWLESHSHGYILVKNRTAVLRMQLGLAPDYFPADFLVSSADTPRWTVTASILQGIAELAGSGGRATVFVLVPAPYQTDPAAFTSYARGLGIDSSAVDLDQPNRLLGAALRSGGACVIDALPLFRAETRRGGRLFGTVDQHLSPSGSVVLAELLRPALVAALESRDAKIACSSVVDSALDWPGK